MTEPVEPVESTEPTVRIVLDNGTIAMQLPSPPSFYLDRENFLGYVWFSHDCTYNGRTHRSETILPYTTAAYNGWTLVQREPLTISPSVACHACGTHGFITDGVWNPCNP